MSARTYVCCVRVRDASVRVDGRTWKRWDVKGEEEGLRNRSRIYYTLVLCSRKRSIKLNRRSTCRWHNRCAGRRNLVFFGPSLVERDKISFALFFFMHFRFSHLKISGIIYVNWISKKLRCDFIERQTPIILFYKYYEWVLDIYTHIYVYVYNPVQGCKYIKLEVWEIGEKSGNFANFLKSNKNFLL